MDEMNKEYLTRDEVIGETYYGVKRLEDAVGGLRKIIEDGHLALLNDTLMLFDKIEGLEKKVAELGKKISALEGKKEGARRKEKAATQEEKKSGTTDAMVVLENKDSESVTVDADCIVDAFWIWEANEAARAVGKNDIGVVGFAVDYTTPENVYDPKAEVIGGRYKMREDVKRFFIMVPDAEKDSGECLRGIEYIKNLAWKIRKMKWPGFVRDVVK